VKKNIYNSETRERTRWKKAFLLMILMMIYEFMLGAQTDLPACNVYIKRSRVRWSGKFRRQQLHIVKRGFLFMVMTWDMSSASPSTTVKWGKIYRNLMGLLHGNFFYDSYFRRIILFFLVPIRSKKKSADVVFLFGNVSKLRGVFPHILLPLLTGTGSCRKGRWNQRDSRMLLHTLLKMIFMALHTHTRWVRGWRSKKNAFHRSFHAKGSWLIEQFLVCIELLANDWSGKNIKFMEFFRRVSIEG
jgi:hypothetical protein